MNSKREFRYLIATDIAARGIDVSDMTHVIHYDLPYEKNAIFIGPEELAERVKAGKRLRL